MPSSAKRSLHSNVLVTVSMVRKREDGGGSGLKLDHSIRAELSASDLEKLFLCTIGTRSLLLSKLIYASFGRIAPISIAERDMEPQ